GAWGLGWPAGRAPVPRSLVLGRALVPGRRLAGSRPLANAAVVARRAVGGRSISRTGVVTLRRRCARRHAVASGPAVTLPGFVRLPGWKPGRRAVPRAGFRLVRGPWQTRAALRRPPRPGPGGRQGP